MLISTGSVPIPGSGNRSGAVAVSCTDKARCRGPAPRREKRRRAAKATPTMQSKAVIASAVTSGATAAFAWSGSGAPSVARPNLRCAAVAASLRGERSLGGDDWPCGNFGVSGGWLPGVRSPVATPVVSPSCATPGEGGGRPVPLPSPTANGERRPSFEVSLTMVMVQHEAQHEDPSSFSFWQLHLLADEQSHAGVGAGSGGSCTPRTSLQHSEQVQPRTPRCAQVSLP